MTMGQPRRSAMNSSIGISILTVLISIAIIAQNGCSVSAIENPSANLDGAAIRSHFSEGRSNEKPQRHSSLRRKMQDEDIITTPEEVLAEAAEEIAEAVAENTEPGDNAALNDSVEELLEAVEELELKEAESEFVGDVSAEETNYPDPTESNPAVEEEDLNYYEEESTVADETDEAAEDSEIIDDLVTSTPSLTPSQPPSQLTVDTPDELPNGEDDLSPFPDDLVTATLSQTPSQTPSQSDKLLNVEDEDEEGEPLTVGSTISPIGAFGEEGEETLLTLAPSAADGEGDYKSPAPTPYPTFDQGELETGYPTTEEEKEEAGEDWWEGQEEGSPWDQEVYPTDKPTPRPTSLYVPKDSGDPLLNEKEPNEKDFNDDTDNIFYHGLGGKVGSYLDGVESPQSMETDKNVQIVVGTLLASFIVALLISSHLVMQYPDGLCAGFCRLTLKVICCFTRTLCLPCRAICCKGSDQASGRRSHAPMRTPFPTDLELA